MDKSPPGPVTKALHRLSRPADALAGKHRRKLRMASWGLFGLIALVIAWDVWLATNQTPGDTWSDAARGAAPSLPLLPWVLGAMVGHIFPVTQRTFAFVDAEAAAVSMGLLTALIVVWTLAIQFRWIPPTSEQAVWVVAILGVFAAYLLWPLRPRSAE